MCLYPVTNLSATFSNVSILQSNYILEATTKSSPFIIVRTLKKVKSTSIDKKQIMSNTKNYFHLMFLLLLILAMSTSSFTFKLNRKSKYVHPAIVTKLNSRETYTERQQYCFTRPNPYIYNMRQHQRLSQTRLCNVEERPIELPNRSMQIDIDEIASYNLPESERKSFMIIKSSRPTDKKDSTTKRTPRMAMNDSPTTIRRSNLKTSSAIAPSSTKTRKSRSSTMPGFASVNTKKQRAFRDGVRIIEETTGRKYIDTPEAKRLRRKINGESMYKNSPSVPDSLLQFATEIHQEERISRKEEILLGEKTQEAIRLQHLFDSLADRLGREPTDDEWCAAAGKINMAAIGQAIEDGIAAKNKLVTSNLRMVQSVVNTYIRNGLSAQYNAGDLMQEGVMALIRAAEKFEPDRGWKFSTYAMYWVRASVKRSQVYQSRIIQVPQRLTENHKRLKRIEKEIIASTGRRPTMKELGAVVGMSEEQVMKCMRAMSQRCYSLDQEIQNTLKPSKAGDSKDTMIEIVESKSKSFLQNEYDRYERAMLREDLVETLNRYLPPEEAELLLVRYGLVKGPNYDSGNIANASTSSGETNVVSVGDQPATIAELSRMFNIKPDKIRRMIDQSLKHLNGVGLDEWSAFERDLP